MLDELWSKIRAATWNFFSNYGKAIVLALVILVLGILVISIVKKAVKKNSVKSRRIDNSAATFITSIVSLVAYVALVILIIVALGGSASNIIAALSSVMLAIALGLQSTLASLANGILLIFTKPFKAGDFVDIGGTSGTVKEIKLFSVKLVTTDNLTVVIPNNTVFGSTIINYSKMPMRRLDVVVPVAYDTDIEKLKKVVLGLVEKDTRIVKNPAPFFRLTEYGASALNFTLRVWSDVSVFWDVKFDLLENMIAAFRANGIEIPYNKLDVHVMKSEGEV